MNGGLQVRDIAAAGAGSANRGTVASTLGEGFSLLAALTQLRLRCRPT
jgi:hypothetical protein